MKIICFIFLYSIFLTGLHAQTVQKNIPEKEKQIVKKIPPAKEERIIDIQDSIIVSEGNITVEIWDNEREDGDTVSVWLNGKLILRDYPIVHERKQIPLQLEKGTTYLLSFYSVSEGYYPPCTGTLKIITTNKTTEIKIAANAEKNGAVKIIYADEK